MTTYIRCFDLGGGGLKTALFSYHEITSEMQIDQAQIKLGKCPGTEKVKHWIRRRMNENGTDLADEIKLGYLFGFSLAGLEKLRDNSQIEATNVAKLFKLPEHKVTMVDDGSAHALASIKMLKGILPVGYIWNFSVGTGIGFGLTDASRHLQSCDAIKIFFDGQEPWSVLEPTTGESVWRACGSESGFDTIVSDLTGITNNRAFSDKAFELFAARWKAFVEIQIIARAKRHQEKFGDPAAIVFTGGNIDYHGNRLVQKINALGLSGIKAYQGPCNAGLYGAAYFAVEHGKV